MVMIAMNVFSGMSPMVSPRALDIRFGQKAVNTNLTSGELKPIRTPLKIGNALLEKAGVKLSIYRFGQDAGEADYWFHWTTNVNVVRGNIADDVTERTYFTGDGVPKYTYSPLAITGGGKQYPYATYNLGVIRPDLITTNVTVTDRVITSITKSGLIATVTTDLPHKLFSDSKAEIFGATEAAYNGVKTVTVIDATRFTYKMTEEPNANAFGTLRFNYGGLPETRLYAITYGDASGAEGAPAILSSTLNVVQGQIVTFTGLPTAPTGNYNYTKKFIYRTGEGNARSTLRFVGEVALAVTSFVDGKIGTELGENIPSLEYEAPPSDLRGLISFSNGMMAGISNNQVCVSFPYQPHAFPISGRYSFNVKPVALGSFGSSIVVMTEGVPSILSGSGHDAMTQDVVKHGQPCLSAHSAVEIAGGVMWASDEGLAYIGNSGFDLATKARLTAREWKKYNPASIRGYRWENRYVGFYTNGLVQSGFVFDVQTLDFYELDFYATAGYTDPKNGNLYLAIGDDVYRFDGGENASLNWKSKQFALPKPVNMGYGKVVADAYPVAFKLYGDGVLRHSRLVNNAMPFALPAGYKASMYEVDVKSSNSVKGIAIAESLSEMRMAIE